MNKGLNCRLKIKYFSIFPTLFCNKKKSVYKPEVNKYVLQNELF